MIQLKPKKSLGQNFLRDKNVARKIVQFFSPRPTDTVLEIGPGTGALTESLVGNCKILYLVEKDHRACEILRESFARYEHVKIISDDFLHVDLGSLTDYRSKTLRVIGNIPYYITSPILFHIIDHRQYIIDAMMMMQLEVARRITAKPSVPDYGILAVLIQTWASVSYEFKVPPTVFHPVPSVESAVIRLVFDRQRALITDEQLYRKVVRGTFGKRRKMLRSSLKPLFPHVPLNQADFSVNLNKRPEELSVEEFITLTRELQHVIKSNERT